MFLYLKEYRDAVPLHPQPTKSKYCHGPRQWREMIHHCVEFIPNFSKLSVQRRTPFPNFFKPNVHSIEYAETGFCNPLPSVSIAPSDIRRPTLSSG